MFAQILMLDRILKEDEGKEEDFNKVTKIIDIVNESNRYIESQKKRREEGKTKNQYDVYFSIGGDIQDEDGIVMYNNLSTSKTKIITQDNQLSIEGATKKDLYMTMMKFMLIGPDIESFESGDELAEYIKDMYRKIVARYEDLIIKNYEKDKNSIDQNDIEVVALSQLYDKSFGEYSKFEKSIGEYGLSRLFPMSIPEVIINKYSKDKSLSEILKKSQVIKTLESGITYWMNREMEKMKEFYEIVIT